MKKYIILILGMTLFSLCLAQDRYLKEMHEYVLQEGLALLKKCKQINEFEDVSSNEIVQAMKLGVVIEDDNDLAYGGLNKAGGHWSHNGMDLTDLGYYFTEGEFLNQGVSATHFWDADVNNADQRGIIDTGYAFGGSYKYTNVPSAIMKAKKYYLSLFAQDPDIYLGDPFKYPLTLNIDGDYEGTFYDEEENEIHLLYKPDEDVRNAELFISNMSDLCDKKMILLVGETRRKVKLSSAQWENFNIIHPRIKNIRYEILGRIIHLLCDMSVPAHVHNDIHAPYMNCTYHVGWDGSWFNINFTNRRYRDFYEGWEVEDQDNLTGIHFHFGESGGFLYNQIVGANDPDNPIPVRINREITYKHLGYYPTLHMVNAQNDIDYLEKLFWNVNQIADHFGSTDVAGDNVYVGQTDLTYINGIKTKFNSIFFDPPSAVFIDEPELDYVNSVKYQKIQDVCMPVAIQATANLLNWVAEKEEFSPQNMTTYIAQGYVRDMNGLPLQGASVSFTTMGYPVNKTYSTSTDQNGHYSLSVTPGNYDITTYKSGYANYSYYQSNCDPFNIATVPANLGYQSVSVPTLVMLINNSNTILVTESNGITIEQALNFARTSALANITIKIAPKSNNQVYTNTLDISGMGSKNLTIEGYNGLPVFNAEAPSIVNIFNDDMGFKLELRNIHFKGDGHLSSAVLSDSPNTTSPIKFNNCKFHNFNNGAIIANSNLFIIGCEFLNNKHTGSVNNWKTGGALFLTASCDLGDFIYLTTIKNNQFTGNYANRGGAVYLEGIFNYEISNNRFDNNRLEFSTSLNDFNGRNIYLDNNQKVTINNNIFVDTADDPNVGDGHYTIWSKDVPDLKIINNTFKGLNNVSAISTYKTIQNIQSNCKIINNAFMGYACGIDNNYYEKYTITHQYNFFSDVSIPMQDGISCNSTEKTNINLMLDPVTFRPIWNSTQFSPCIDAGDPDLNGDNKLWNIDGWDCDNDASRLNVGAMDVSPHAQIRHNLVSENNGINWVSFPAVNMLTNNASQALNVLANRNYSSLISSYYLTEMYWYPLSLNPPKISINRFDGYWTPLTHTINRWQGYKIRMNQAMPLEVSGQNLEADHNLTLYVNPTLIGNPLINEEQKYNWVGYYLKESMSPWDAFAPVLDKIDVIKTRHWTSVKDANGNWSSQASGGKEWVLNYGDLLMVHCTQTCTFTLGDNGFPQDPKSRTLAKTFVYEEDTDYLPVLVQVDNMAKSTESEIGLFVNGICKGAAVIQDSLVQINAYVIGDTLDWNSAVVEFVINTPGKSMPEVFNNYYTYNEKSKTYTNKQLNFADNHFVHQVKLTNSHENIPVIKTGIAGNYPNPFNPSTSINYSIQKETMVSLDIFNIKGQKVKTLLNEVVKSGDHQITWQGRDSSGNTCASGIYFLRMSAEGKNYTHKMMLIK
ncbi:MAG TPA: carboxypeptidase regulatory-like domain-containing protein [Candidatus Cloacimonadota bacterium]|nr:carboxypeptidase regulatory-like domain-containing protein [Candidatus Cloacimonadota bacterium]